MTELMKKAVEKRDERIGLRFTLHYGAKNHGKATAFSNDRMGLKSFRVIHEFCGAFWIQTAAGGLITLSKEEASHEDFRVSLEKKKIPLLAWIKIPSEDHFARVRYTRANVLPWKPEDGPRGWHRVEAKDIEVEVYE